ncbi:hypothetical protein ACT8ZV_02350 [Nocardioides sp. MAHUQ-72]|uniref:hypothetical protein n=1 Tax=unclassified Nocardioides TaxID=2615069 RepID=UPI00361D0582
MGLQRTHRTYKHERFGPVRLGPQDLRDLAEIFADLDSKVDLALPQFRTKFHLAEHETDSIEDVLAFEDADTIPSLHILSGQLRLSFQASDSGTLLTKPFAPEAAADQQAVEDAAEKLRQIIRARQLTGLASLRQRGPGKLLLAALFALPALLLVGGQPVMDLWLTSTASQAVVAGLVWLCVLLLVLLSAPSKGLIRLRGRELPWWERRQGLIALLGLVVTVVIPFVIFGLEGGQK